MCVQNNGIEAVIVYALCVRKGVRGVEHGSPRLFPLPKICRVCGQLYFSYPGPGCPLNQV